MFGDFYEVFGENTADVVTEYAEEEVAKALERLDIPKEYWSLIYPRLEAFLISTVQANVIHWFDFDTEIAKIWAGLMDWPEDSFTQEGKKWKN